MEVANHEKMKKLLLDKHNVILQGAPGTGKTYSTAALALAIINPEFKDFNNHAKVMEEYQKLLIENDDEGHVCNNGQIGFVTFHQSMDYEDFVEGLKPVVDEKMHAVQYKVMPGIFKSITEKAQSDLKARAFHDNSETFDDKNVQANGNDFDLYWSKLVAFLKKELKKGSVALDSQRTSQYVKQIDENRIIMNESITKNLIRNLWEKFGKEESLEVTDLPLSGNRSNRYAILKKIQEIRDELDTKTVLMKKFEEDIKISNKDQHSKTEQHGSLKNYVLIIDEINRGNVSKIFGELISLLEADKRDGGEHRLSVILPYSKESFSVPSNLYIIGTMNTTDRSVGSIDYAVRRRFAFVTLEADRNKVPDKDDSDDLFNDARDLFDAVRNFLDQSKCDMDIEDLMVGHSYFMAKNADCLKLKWQYEILPLLMEYHKDGIISQSPLQDMNKADIANCKTDYKSFVKVWNEKSDN